MCSRSMCELTDLRWSFEVVQHQVRGSERVEARCPVAAAGTGAAFEAAEGGVAVFAVLERRRPGVGRGVVRVAGARTGQQGNLRRDAGGQSAADQGGRAGDGLEG